MWMVALTLWACQQMKAETLNAQLGQTLQGACLALGNDLVHLPAFTHSLTPEFIDRVYSPAELAYCHSFSEPLLRYASTWAAKEAVYKALKQVSTNMPGWKQIEIIRYMPAGQPFVNLPAAFATFKVSLSISHEGQYAWAIACLSIPEPVRI